MKIHWPRLAILLVLLWIAVPPASQVGLSQAGGDDEFIQLGLAYIQAQEPDRQATLLSSHTFAHSETGIAYTLVKAELDGWDGRLVTVRHSDGFVTPGNSLPEKDHLDYITALPAPYQKMSANLRLHIGKLYGSMPDPQTAYSLENVEPLPVIFIATPDSDLQAIADQARQFTQAISVYDGAQVFHQSVLKGNAPAGAPEDAIRLVAAHPALPSRWRARPLAAAAAAGAAGACAGRRGARRAVLCV